MGFKVEFDAYSSGLLLRIMTFESLWHVYMNELAIKMGEDAREHIKPFTTAKSEWNGSTHGTGAMADSVREVVQMNGGNFGITFQGNFYGNYLDVGNSPPLSSRSGKPLPIGYRAGQRGADITHRIVVQGVGNYNKQDWPAHFSEKTADWLAEEGNMQKYCDDFIGGFLRELILP